MANVAQCLRRSIIQCHRTIPYKRKWQAPISVSHRQFTSTPSRFKDDGSESLKNQPLDAENNLTRWLQENINQENLQRDSVASFESLSPTEQQQLRDQWEQIDPETIEEMDQEIEASIGQMGHSIRERDVEDEFSFPISRPRPKELGFWAEDEDDEDAMVEDMDDEFKDDDITSMAHAELELHREIREYTRIAAWEMPFLQSLSKPFAKPNPEELPLRFRYTTYMGESHPAQKKVVVDFHLDDLNLSPLGRSKLPKLLGPRYNPEYNSAKISCEKFETPAQNKRYLGDLIKNLINEAENGEDTLEDIPLDLRHYKKKPVPSFPREWMLGSDNRGGSVGKVQNLLKQREERKQLEGARVLVDGEAEVQMQYAYAMRAQR